MTLKSMKDNSIKEIFVIVLAVVILSLSVIFKGVNGKTNFIRDFPIAFLSFFIIIFLSILVKKIVAHHYEADIKIKLWELYRYGFRKGAHLKRPTPMVWLPLILTLFSRGAIWWMGILSFDIKAKPERVSKRHGLYRFSEMTEWHIGLISLWGVISCLILSVIGYIIGFEYFAQLSTYYAAWSLAPISNLDGTKIFFGNRTIWFTISILTLFFLVAAFMI